MVWWWVCWFGCLQVPCFFSVPFVFLWCVSIRGKYYRTLIELWQLCLVSVAGLSENSVQGSPQLSFLPLQAFIPNVYRWIGTVHAVETRIWHSFYRWIDTVQAVETRIWHSVYRWIDTMHAVETGSVQCQLLRTIQYLLMTRHCACSWNPNMAKCLQMNRHCACSWNPNMAQCLQMNRHCACSWIYVECFVESILNVSLNPLWILCMIVLGSSRWHTNRQ